MLMFAPDASVFVWFQPCVRHPLNIESIGSDYSVGTIQITHSRKTAKSSYLSHSLQDGKQMGWSERKRERKKNSKDTRNKGDGREGEKQMSNEEEMQIKREVSAGLRGQTHSLSDERTPPQSPQS